MKDRHLPDEFSNGRNRHFVIGLHAFPLLHKLSEQYSFVCVLRADRLPGPDKSLLPVQRPKPWKGQIPIYKPVHYGTS